MCGAALEGGKLQRFTDRAVLFGIVLDVWPFVGGWFAALDQRRDRGRSSRGRVCVLEVVS